MSYPLFLFTPMLYIQKSWLSLPIIFLSYTQNPIMIYIYHIYPVYSDHAVYMLVCTEHTTQFNVNLIILYYNHGYSFARPNRSSITPFIFTYPLTWITTHILFVQEFIFCVSYIHTNHPTIYTSYFSHYIISTIQ